ncbi:unnamed protein product [Ilex paraguariensis]|uniref:Enoyl reductase (ER) domain-containing protein n=1 Tax=Ilex paraguariensis TaxID=185542 RepID=A0ABC8SFV4_9AQUA
MSKSQEVEAFGWACRDPSGVLSPFKFSRRFWATGDQDVRLKVLYCGICRSDLMMNKDYWGVAMYPTVQGREIVGVVTEVGKKVQKFKVGDKGGVGCFVGSCWKCKSCANNLENHCPDQMPIGTPPYIDGMIIHGGFSDHIVTDEHFVLRWPDNLPLDSGVPLLGAGITMYSPLKYFGLDKPGMHIGVVGLGGHGHLTVKIIKALGGKVTVISTSPEKEVVIKSLGVDSFLVSSDLDQMQIAMGTLDGIIYTIPAVHPLQPLIDLLKTHGKLVMGGGPVELLDLPVSLLIVGKYISLTGMYKKSRDAWSCTTLSYLALVFDITLGFIYKIEKDSIADLGYGMIGRKIVAGTDLGGLKETQEILDFAAKHNIIADVGVIPIDNVNTAMECLEKGDVRYRFVLDVANTLKTT